jgi:hypothetical protein
MIGFRVRIAGVMGLVALVALDFAATRTLVVNYHHDWAITLLFGALPMANIVAAIAVVGVWRGGRQPILWRFVVFGAIAMALFNGIMLCWPRSAFTWYSESLIRSTAELVVDVDGIRTPRRRIVIYSIAVIMCALPQLAFAVFFAFFRITIERRRFSQVIASSRSS